MIQVVFVLMIIANDYSRCQMVAQDEMNEMSEQNEVNEHEGGVEEERITNESGRSGEEYDPDFSRISKNIDSGDDLHPIELIAHSILSGPLDNLHENFQLLHKSQIILLTRLKLIEERLASIQNTNKSIDDKDINGDIQKIRAIRVRLQGIDKVLDKITKRIDKIDIEQV